MRGCKLKVLCSVAIFCIAFSSTHTLKENLICSRKKKWGWGEREAERDLETKTDRQPPKRWCLIEWGITWHYFSIPEAISTLGLSKKFPLLLKFLCGFNVTLSFAITTTKSCLMHFPYTSGFLCLHSCVCVALALHLRALLRVFSQLWRFLPWLTQPPGPSSKPHRQQPERLCL